MGLLNIFKKDLTKIKSEEIARDESALEQQERQFERRLADKNDQLETLRLYYEQEKLTQGETEQVARQRTTLKKEAAEITNHLNLIQGERLASMGLKYAKLRDESSQKSSLLGELSKLDPRERERILIKLGAADEKMRQTITSVRDVIGIPTTPQDIKRTMSPEMREELENIKRAQERL